MRKDKFNAAIELDAAETKKFSEDAEFRARVFRAASDLSDATDRTVIVFGDDKELGTYNNHREWEPAPTGGEARP